jgi:hypothetical protein
MEHVVYLYCTVNLTFPSIRLELIHRLSFGPQHTHPTSATWRSATRLSQGRHSAAMLTLSQFLPNYALELNVQFDWLCQKRGVVPLQQLASLNKAGIRTLNSIMELLRRAKADKTNNDQERTHSFSMRQFAVFVFEETDKVEGDDRVEMGSRFAWHCVLDIKLMRTQPCHISPLFFLCNLLYKQMHSRYVVSTF